MQLLIGSLLVLASALGFSALPLFALLAYDRGVTVLTLLFIRFCLATLAFFAIILIRRQKIAVNRRQLGGMLLLGSVLYTLQSMLYFSSVRYVSPALAALFLYTYPLMVALLNAWVAKERLTQRIVGALLLSTFGVGLILGSGGKLDARGVALALGAAIVYSIYIIVGNRLIKQVPSLVASAFIALAAAGSFLVIGSASHGLRFDFSPAAWPAIVGLAVFCTIMAMLTFFAGMARIGATRASILSNMEPVLTALLSVIFLRQPLTLMQLIGGCAVVAGGLLAVMPGRHSAQGAAPLFHRQRQG